MIIFYMLTIIFEPKKINPQRAGGMYFKGILIKPGRNSFSDKQTKMIKSLPEYEQYIQKEAIIVLDETPDIKVEDKEDTKKVSEPVRYELNDLKNLTVREAVKVIGHETDLETLQLWKQNETIGKKRATIINMVTQQIRNVEQGSL